MVAAGDPRGYYKLLGVHRTASAEEIKAAFRERAKLYHPDGNGSGANEDRFHRLREAYEALRDPQRRLHYDAEGLAAERRNEQSWRGRGQQAPRAARSGARGDARAAAMHRLSSAPPPVLLAGLGALGIVLLAALVALGVTWSRLDARDATIAELSDRLEQTAADAGAQPMASLFRTELLFPGRSADLDADLRAQLDTAIATLRQTAGGLSAGRDWVLLVEGQADRAADEAGLLIDGWEQALLRAGAITDRLVQQGIPAERIAVRLQAGFAPAGAAGTGSRPVELKLLCCRG